MPREVRGEIEGSRGKDGGRVEGRSEKLGF